MGKKLRNAPFINLANNEPLEVKSHSTESVGICFWFRHWNVRSVNDLKFRLSNWIEQFDFNFKMQFPPAPYPSFNLSFCAITYGMQAHFLPQRNRRVNSWCKKKFPSKNFYKADRHFYVEGKWTVLKISVQVWGAQKHFSITCSLCVSSNKAESRKNVPV